MRSSVHHWRHLRLGLLGIGSSSGTSFDKPVEALDTKTRYECSEDVDGWTRLTFVFMKNSPEMNDVMESTTLAYLSGFVIGGFSRSRNAYRRFVEEHKHEMFKHPRDAQSKLRERIFLELFKGGIKYGLHIGVLTFTFTVATSCFMAYRNARNPLDYALCGGVLGSLYNIIQGPKAAFSSGFLGSVFGLICGVFSLAAEKISGESVKDHWLREYRRIQDEEELTLMRTKEVSSEWNYEHKEDEKDGYWDKTVRSIVTKLRSLFLSSSD